MSSDWAARSAAKLHEKLGSKRTGHHVVSVEQERDVVIEDHAFDTLAAGVPLGRYRTLLRQVLDRLPAGWDHYRTFDVTVSDEWSERGYAGCRREEELGCSDDDPQIEGHHEQVWQIELSRPQLEPLSDEAVQWVIAHELGHVGSGIPCGSFAIGSTPYTRMSGTEDQYRAITPGERQAQEKVADAIARAWGFWLEEEAFEAEAAR